MQNMIDLNYIVNSCTLIAFAGKCKDNIIKDQNKKRKTKISFTTMIFIFFMNKS